MADEPEGRQVAALPFRQGPQGLEILLITSRETRRWVIPKGWPMAGRSDAAAAAQEAFEEAGLQGVIAEAPFGDYGYLKLRPKAGDISVRVEVFPMRVEGQAALWPEQGQRDQCWLPALEAAEAVDEPELRQLIRRFATH